MRAYLPRTKLDAFCSISHLKGMRRIISRAKICGLISCILMGAFFVVPSYAGKARSAREGGSKLAGLIQNIRTLVKEECETSQDRFNTVKKIDIMLIAIRLSAKNLGNLKGSLEHSDKLLWQAFNSSMDYNNNKVTGDDAILRLTAYSQPIVVKNSASKNIGEIQVSDWASEPQALILDSHVAVLPPSRQKQALAYLCSSSDRLDQVHALQDLEMATQKMAQNFFAEPMLESFNSKTVVNQLLKRCGVVMGNGITLRPLAPQDAAFAQYANLGCKGSDEMLFWADPMVLNGYHPEFGGTLNVTALKGYKKVDMDDILSRGYSGVIDKWNRLQPPEERIVNPFRGYASKTVPGLVLMAQQGRLNEGKPPTDEQLQEAMKLTKHLHLLPSQTMPFAAQKTTWMRYSSRGDAADFPQSISCSPYTYRSGSGVCVKLLPHDAEDFNAVMVLARERAVDISKLKKENIISRFYAQRIVDSLTAINEELSTTKIFMNPPLGHMPQPFLIHNEILSCTEYYRGLISDLHHQYNDLCQKEWEVAMRVLEIKETYVTKLQEQAPVRAASFEMREMYNK